MIGGTFLHYLHVLGGSELPQTQTTDAERAMLVSYLKLAASGSLRSVFSKRFTTRLLAESSDPDAVVYGVDPFFAGRLGISWGFRIVTHYNRQFLLSGKLKLVRTVSTKVAEAVQNWSITCSLTPTIHSMGLPRTGRFGVIGSNRVALLLCMMFFCRETNLKLLSWAAINISAPIFALIAISIWSTSKIRWRSLERFRWPRCRCIALPEKSAKVACGQ